ncbi:MAG: hypothetical protein KJ811_00865 [Candidatus Margulisbacteria bacterium]|nr:hypothetical protein [Candidatus Margulisiibacteriota bacterium]
MKVMKLFLVGFLVSLIFMSGQVLALEASLLGGYRSSGVAAGLTLEQSITDNTKIRIGAVGSSGTPSSIYLLGLKVYLGDMADRYPTHIVLGFSPEAATMYNNGAGVSLIFDNAFGLAPVFVETGVDFTYGGESTTTTALAAVRLQLMFGYRFGF